MSSILKDLCCIKTQEQIDQLKQDLINSVLFTVYKPIGWTSQNVVSFLKRFLKVKKIGHGGTLDPLACGLLVIGINQGTKMLFQHLNATKEYITTIQFGVQTSTGDVEGDVVQKNDTIVNLQDLEKQIANFNNCEYEQTPPIYSALKVNGKKLYEYARKNQEVKIEPRKVKIYEIKLLNFSNNQAKIGLKVSKGFYVRSFSEELAKKLNTYGHLIYLERVASGDFALNQDTIDIKQLKQILN